MPTTTANKDTIIWTIMIGKVTGGEVGDVAIDALLVGVILPRARFPVTILIDVVLPR